MGNSTEHTAYLRLKSGFPAPESGSASLNGRVIAEQIGAQIFIDGWGMVAPGNPGLAASLAQRAASVSHDGEAVYAAQLIAAMDALAFIEPKLDRLLDAAVTFIPGDCLVYRLIADLRDWRAGEADWRATDVRVTAAGTRFGLLVRGETRGELEAPLQGDHNVRNVLAALAAAEAAGADLDLAVEAVARFRGVKRRLELRGVVRGISVFDDFAHHPTAVEATLRAARAQAEAEGPLGRIFAVFEPRSYTSRTRAFLEGFGQALAEADVALVAAAHLPAKVPERDRLSEGDLVRAIVRHGGAAEHVPTVEAIVLRLRSELRPGDRVLVLSNGGFGGIHEKLLAARAEEPQNSV
jgi:hypothetical protein